MRYHLRGRLRQRNRLLASHLCRNPLCLEQLEDRALLNAGVLDPSFGASGVVTTKFPIAGGQIQQVMDVVVQPDGKILVVGQVATFSGPPPVNDVMLARYNVDGTLDSTFGTSGSVNVAATQDNSDKLALQPDGKIIVTDGSDLFRFSPGGALDGTFGTGGMVKLAPNDGTTVPDLALQSDGKIVVAGASVQRFNADGSADQSFGTAGQITLNSSADSRSVAIQSDGHILVESKLRSQDASVLERFNSDGSGDASFGTGGEVAVAFAGNDVALQLDGRIVVAGEAPHPVATDPIILEVGRFNANGTVDETFGTSGAAITTVPDISIALINEVLIQKDGKIVGIGSALQTTPGPSTNFPAAFRFNPNSTLDTSFGTFAGGGISILTGNPGSAAAGAFQADGKIVAAGTTEFRTDFTVVRYTADPAIMDLNTHFVTQVYLDLLQRQPDPTGLAAFVAALNSGATRTQVVAAIENSLEYHILEVEKLYGLLLNRPPDPSGFTTWVNFLNQGGSYNQLETIFLNSDEYFVRRGGSMSDRYLQAIYGDVLHRPIDNVGAQVWGNALLTGSMTRMAVAAAIVGSQESNMDQVAALYHQFLRRDPDPTGLTAFTNALQQGVSYEAVLAIIVGSPEYATADLF